MNGNGLRSVLHLEVPGNVFINVVVQDQDTEIVVDHQVPEGIPPATTALVLSQVLSAILPAGQAGFHAWRTYSAIRADFEAINDQMANVPTLSEDELPF